MAGNERDRAVRTDDAGTNTSETDDKKKTVLSVEAWARTGKESSGNGAGLSEIARGIAGAVADWMPSLSLDGMKDQLGKKPDKFTKDAAARGPEAVDALPATAEGRIVRSLNHMAEDPEFLKRSALGGKAITQDALGKALLIDEHGWSQNNNFLSKKERADVQNLYQTWDRLGRDKITSKDLSNFTNERIAEAAAGIARGAAAGISGNETGAKGGSSKSNNTVDRSGKPTGQDSSERPASSLGGKMGEAAGQALAEAMLKQFPGTIDQKTDAKFPGATDQKTDAMPASGDSGVRKDVPYLGTSEFPKRAQALFPQLDADKDGVLSEAELSAAMEDRQYKGQDAQVVAALYKYRSELKGLSDDQTFFESGITISDLDRFEQIDKQRTQEHGPAAQARDWMTDDKNFKATDKDGDGFLSRAELEGSLRTAKSEQERSMFQYMIRNLDTIQSASNDEWGPENDGITRADLNTHTENVLYKNNGAEIIGKVAGVMYRTNESQKAEARYDLYGTRNPLDSIKPDAIKQGMIGDCYFLASLAAVAKSNPQAIANMIKDNKDGTYTVTFPGAPNEPITVKAPTEAEAGLYNGVGKEGTWALVMEKAYGKYCQESVFRRGPFNIGGGNTPAEGGDGGGRTSGTMRLLTGRDTESESLSASRRDQTRQKLEAAFSGSPARAVTAGINGNLLPSFLGGKDTSDDGFPRRHAYSVVGFQPDGQGGGKVIIRNPWAGSDGTTSGTMEITLDQFINNFSDVTYQK